MSSLSAWTTIIHPEQVSYPCVPLYSCGCLTTVLGGGGLKRLPTLAPGASFSLQVTLDTAQMADIISTPLLAGSETQKQVWVYTTADSLHAAAVLEMRGHIMSGVSMEPATLNFGNVGEADGVSRIVRITYASALYREGLTHLIAPKGSSLHITALPISTGEPHRSETKSDVVRSYRVGLSPHAPIGALSGQLRVEGLAARKLPVRVGRMNVTPPALTRSLPFVGQVKGSISAQPGMAVFGVISLSNRAAASQLADRKQRTRWILLQRETPADSSPSGKSDPGAFWQGATVHVDSTQFQATLLAPALSGPGSAGASAQTLSSPPVAVGSQKGGVYWLRPTLMPSAPRGKSVAAEVIVTLRDGERLRVPILAQTQ